MNATGTREFVIAVKFLSVLQNISLFPNEANQTHLYITTIQLITLLGTHGLN